MNEENPQKKITIGPKILNFLKTKRGIALIKLISFFLFFLLFYLLTLNVPRKTYKPDLMSSSSSSSDISSMIEPEKTLADYKEKLINEDYSFIAVIKLVNDEQILIGERKAGLINGQAKGFINGVKFTIKDNIVYNSENIIDSEILYGVNLTYLDGAKIMEMINESEPIISYDDQGYRIYSYTLDNLKTIVSFNDTSCNIEFEEKEPNNLYSITFTF